MIIASHHPLFAWFFKHYSRLMIKWHFREVLFEGDLSAPSGPILVVANHFSWWDGFFIYQLNNKFWHKRFHVMMLEKQLKNRRFLNKVGAFSISATGDSTLRSMRYATSLLQNNKNLLTIFPQGHFTSQGAIPVKFEGGAQFLIRHSASHVKMVVILVDYFSHRKPFLSFYVQDYTEKDKQDSLENSYNRFYNRCIERQNQKALL